MATDRRIRTKWVMRQRYQRAANIATAVGLVAGVAIVAFIWPHEVGAWRDRRFLLTATLILLLATLGPCLLVKYLWRTIRWRKFEEWS